MHFQLPCLLPTGYSCHLYVFDRISVILAATSFVGYCFMNDTSASSCRIVADMRSFLRPILPASEPFYFLLLTPAIPESLATILVPTTNPFVVMLSEGGVQLSGLTVCDLITTLYPTGATRIPETDFSYLIRSAQEGSKAWFDAAVTSNGKHIPVPLTEASLTPLPLIPFVTELLQYFEPANGAVLSFRPRSKLPQQACAFQARHLHLVVLKPPGTPAPKSQHLWLVNGQTLSRLSLDIGLTGNDRTITNHDLFFFVQAFTFAAGVPLYSFFNCPELFAFLPQIP